MPIVQPTRTAADDFLDAPAGTPPPQPTPTPMPRGGIVGGPPKSAADAFLDQAAPQKGILSRAVGSWYDQVDPIEGVKGLAHIATHPPEEFVGNVYRAGRDLVVSGAEDLGAGNTSRGIRKMISGFVPVIGPSLNKAGEQIEQGDYAGAFGTGAGIATNLLSGRIAKGIGGSRAVAGIRSGMQSGANRIYRVGAPGMTPELAEFGTTQGIPYTEAGKQKLGGIRETAGQAIGGPIRSAPQTPSVQYAPVETALEDLKQKYLKSEAPPIEAEKQKFLGEVSPQPGATPQDMTPGQAFDLKVKYQNRANRMKETAYSQGLSETSPELASVKKVPSELGDQLVAQFPEIKGENAIYGASSELQPIVDRVVELHARKNPLPAWTSAAGGALSYAAGGPAAGVSAAMALEIMRNPALRSQIAIALSKASRVPLSEATARVAGYLNAVVAGEREGRANQETP